MTTAKTRLPQAEQSALVLDAYLEKRETIVSQIETFVSRGAETKRMFDDLVDQNTSSAITPLKAELASLDGQLVSLLNQRRPSFRRWFGRTLKLPHGVIRWYNAPVSLQVPKDTQKAVDVLLGRRGGRAHLRVKYELNLLSLVWADPRLLRAIGAKRQAHELLQLSRVNDKGVAIGKPIELQRRPRRAVRGANKD